MKVVILNLILLLIAVTGFTQVTNTSCSTAKELLNQTSEFNYCSIDGEYSTVSSGVWFKFIAKRSDITITVAGKMAGSLATVLVPNLLLYEDCGNNIYSLVTHSDNLTTLYKGGLIIGKSYSFMVLGANIGTFTLCINNYTPMLRAGQDCETASFLCNKQTFTQNDVSGAGQKNNEASGTCLASFGVSSEQNSVWYRWKAANNGILTFTITPSSRDDIDWVLFDLGVDDDCSQMSPATAIRCAAGRGIDCNGPNQRVYTKTGLDLTSTDISESGGCSTEQDGFVKYVDMKQDHIYSLLVNNFDTSGHGFTIEFGGNGEFVGPRASIDASNSSYLINQLYTFRSLSSNYSNIKWSFGEGASIPTATTEGPFDISYATPGKKTVVLEAFNSKGCSVIDTKEFTVTGNPPVIISKKGVIHSYSFFTPNGDGLNDEFVVEVLNIKSYRLQIFDRNGAQVFVSDDVTKKWNGFYETNPLPVGEYYYVIDAIDLSGDSLVKAGSVTILR